MALLLRGTDAAAATNPLETTTHPPHTHSAAIDKLRSQNARLKEELLLENKFSM